MATLKKTSIAESVADKKPGQDSRSLVLKHAANELVFAVVGHVGSGTSTVANVLAELLGSPSLSGGRYEVEMLSAREQIEAWAEKSGQALPTTKRTDIATTIALQRLGDEMRRTNTDNSAVARALIARVRGEDILARRKTDDDFPFLLISRRTQQSTNSGVRVEDRIKMSPNPACMHPDDLRALSLAPGDRVESRSRHASIIGFVEADRELRRGVVAMSHGYGARHGRPYDPRRDGANVNQLLRWDDDYDPYHGMPRMSAIPIAIRAAEEEQAAV